MRTYSITVDIDEANLKHVQREAHSKLGATSVLRSLIDSLVAAAVSDEEKS